MLRQLCFVSCPPEGILMAQENDPQQEDTFFISHDFGSHWKSSLLQHAVNQSSSQGQSATCGELSAPPLTEECFRDIRPGSWIQNRVTGWAMGTVTRTQHLTYILFVLLCFRRRVFLYIQELPLKTRLIFHSFTCPCLPNTGD